MDKGINARNIALKINKSVPSITREIDRNKTIFPGLSDAQCPILSKSPHVCNNCINKEQCTFTRAIYDAIKANEKSVDYRSTCRMKEVTKRPRWKPKSKENNVITVVEKPVNSSKSSSNKNYKQLTLKEREIICDMLNHNNTISQIAEELNRNKSTVLREIKRNVIREYPKMNDCIYAHNCAVRNSDCYNNCKNYTSEICPNLQSAPYVCNGCVDYNRCKKQKNTYRPVSAHNKMLEIRKTKNNGFRYSDEELKILDELLTDIIVKKKQSPYAASEIFKKDYGINISVGTIYNLVNSCKIHVRPIDLRECVARKRRKYKKKPRDNNYYKTMSIIKEGHKYADFCEFVKQNPETMVCEMDCVEGKKKDVSALLTLYWKCCHMQIAIHMDRHNAHSVVYSLDMLEEMLGLDLFRFAFGIILTDNGEEFSDLEGLQRSCTVPGEQRCFVYYCEPMQSQQKSGCERNHRIMRDIFTKGKNGLYLDDFCQKDISEMIDNLNSYIRKSTDGISPYAKAKTIFPEDFFLILGLTEIPAKDVVMSPSVLIQSLKKRLNKE